MTSLPPLLKCRIVEPPPLLRAPIMIIVRLLSPGPWLVGTAKVYSGVGADRRIVPTAAVGIGGRRANHRLATFNGPKKNKTRTPQTMPNGE
jgi:hypothetical protein